MLALLSKGYKMNINYSIANMIHSSVVNSTMVSGNILLDDEHYPAMLTNLINENHANVDTQGIIDKLVDYVNNNY